MTSRIAINGFGRIGRLAFRHLMRADDLEIAGLNDLGDLENLAYLLAHDSAHDPPAVEVEAGDGVLRFGDREVPFVSETDPSNLPWSEMEVDTVIEATGAFTDREGASKHLEAGADRVLISAPGKGADVTICMGVNEEVYDPQRHRIVSNASCTTNCLAPVAKVLDDSFGLVNGFLTTVHGVTSSQALIDSPHKKWRRGRSALASIVPTTTGAAVATTDVLPELEGKMDGMAMRVPVITGSIIDFVARLESSVSTESVNEAFRRAANSEAMEGILGVSDEELVSVDIIGSPYSALVDAPSTRVVGDDTVKVLAWYDNEWGYAQRVIDLARYLGERSD
ncbi:MAG: type I glyceraldehyde-3-phosphate dehydrogenase [Persicimonas sp.]